MGEKRYFAIMEMMLKENNYNVEENSKVLWMGEREVKNLYESGNIIGLHSYSHPTVMENKSFAEQKGEYGRNKEQLEKIIGKNITTVSYPSNSYNKDTMELMNELGISVGFRANMSELVYMNEKLEIPREDHANILKKMEETRK